MQTAQPAAPSTPFFFAIFCILFATIFSYTLSIIAGPYIVGELGGSNDIATYGVSFYALGNALGIPLGKPLIPRMGATRLLVIAIVLFAFFTGVCAISPTFPIFNIARFFQGFVSGPFYAVIFSFLGIFSPPEKRERFRAIALTIFTVGPVIGASWGGIIAYLWNWKWAFVFNVPLLLILALYFGLRLRKYPFAKETPSPFDMVGYISFFLGIFCLGTYGIMAQELDWYRSTTLNYLLAIGTISFIFFILWEWNHPSPIVPIKLLKKKPIVSFALFNLSVLFSVFFGIVILLSLWLKIWVNYTPDWIAALLGIMALSAPFPLLSAHPRIKVIDNRFFLALAIILLALSCFKTMFFNIEVNLGRIVTSRLLAGFGLAFFLAPLFRLCFNRLQDEESVDVLSLFQITRALSSGIGASVYDIIWQRRRIFFHERLGSKITVFSDQTKEFFAKAKTIGLEGLNADAQLDYYLQQEATSLALDDCFYLMAWVLVGLLVILVATFFLKRSSFLTRADFHN